MYITNNVSIIIYFYPFFLLKQLSGKVKRLKNSLLIIFIMINIFLFDRRKRQRTRESLDLKIECVNEANFPGRNAPGSSGDGVVIVLRGQAKGSGRPPSRLQGYFPGQYLFIHLSPIYYIVLVVRRPSFYFYSHLFIYLFFRWYAEGSSGPVQAEINNHRDGGGRRAILNEVVQPCTGHPPVRPIRPFRPIRDDLRWRARALYMHIAIYLPLMRRDNAKSPSRNYLIGSLCSRNGREKSKSVSLSHGNTHKTHKTHSWLERSLQLFWKWMEASVSKTYCFVSFDPNLLLRAITRIKVAFSQNRLTLLMTVFSERVHYVNCCY